MKIKSASVVLGITFAFSAGSSQAALIAHWNFNGFSTTATSFAPSSGQAGAQVSVANFTGTASSFGGTTLNSVGTDIAGDALSLVGGSNPFGNGSNITVSFATSGLSQVVITFATQRTASGYNSNQWAYSTNGVDFADVGSAVVPPTSFGLSTLDLSSVTAINDKPSVTLRYTLNGATASSGNNRIDNFQINAIPEPTTTIPLLGIGAIAFLFRRR